jgi:hypothetical protein
MSYWEHMEANFGVVYKCLVLAVFRAVHGVAEGNSEIEKKTNRLRMKISNALTRI